MLDEGIDVLTGLWSGEPFTYAGKHFPVDDVTFTPIPVQRPRVPIWVVGAWPRMKSMRRVLRCDGIIPSNAAKFDDASPAITPDTIREMKAWIDEHRTATTPFDILWEENSPGNAPDRAADITREWADAGVTWWLESVWDEPRTRAGLTGMRERINQGPPRPQG
jgi:hypothetical protein